MNKAVLHCAVDLLSRREHTFKELLQKLRVRDQSKEDITPVLDYLSDKDYLSKERFADKPIT